MSLDFTVSSQVVLNANFLWSSQHFRPPRPIPNRPASQTTADIPGCFEDQTANQDQAKT